MEPLDCVLCYSSLKPVLTPLVWTAIVIMTPWVTALGRSRQEARWVVFVHGVLLGCWGVTHLMDGSWVIGAVCGLIFGVCSAWRLEFCSVCQRARTAQAGFCVQCGAPAATKNPAD